MAELVDAADLKSAGRKAVGVQVPLPPLNFDDAPLPVRAHSQPSVRLIQHPQPLLPGLGLFLIPRIDHRD